MTSAASPPPAVYAGAAPSPAPAASAPPADAADAAPLAYSGYVQYDSRYAVEIVHADASFSPSDRRFRPFAALDYDYDTRSSPGLGNVLNDDAVVPRAGYRYDLDPDGYASVFATAGYSFGLRGQASYPETRYGVEYARDFGEPAGPRPQANVFGDLTQYSRYAGDTIAEGEADWSARLARSLRLLIGGDFSLDTVREYGNNYAEAYGGLRVPVTATVALDCKALVGSYLSRGAGRPADPNYRGYLIELDVWR